MPITKTRYGNIDKDALENLQEGDFDLQKFHKALDVLQNLRGDLYEFTEELHKVANMSYGLLAGDEAYNVDSDLSLPELAESISYQAMEYLQAFETIHDALSELEDGLNPIKVRNAT